MNNRITSDEVSIQFSKAIKLLLEWSKQEFAITSTSSREKTLPQVSPPLRSIPEPDKLLRASEIAKILQISKTLAYRMINQGVIPVVRVTERTVRVRQQDLEDFINKRN